MIYDELMLQAIMAGMVLAFIGFLIERFRDAVPNRAKSLI